MPLIAIRTSVQVPEAGRLALLHQCSKTLASLTGKPEAYVMTMLESVTAMTMAGTDEPACFVDVRGVGKFNGQQARAMSAAFCSLLQERLGVSSARVYVNFTGFEGSMWGFDGSTFG